MGFLALRLARIDVCTNRDLAHSTKGLRLDARAAPYTYLGSGGIELESRYRAAHAARVLKEGFEA